MYLFTSLAAMVLLNLFIPVHQVIVYPWNATGIVPLVFGLVLNLSTDKSFNKIGTTVNPFEDSKTLITSGAFRYTRNPMYLGMVLVLTGVAFLLGTLSPFIIPPIFAITMDRVFIINEEMKLDDRFGDKWKEYKARVRRWI